MNPTEYAASVRESYNAERKKVNFLVIGNSGTGKTVLAETCPAPIHIDSFDPGGTVSVRDAIESGRVIADTSFEKEVQKQPSAYKNWQRVMNQRMQMHYFDVLGTYVLDSLTLFYSAVMNQTLKENRNLTRIPELRDHNKATLVMRDEIGELTQLPCNVLVTAHIDRETDQLTGRMFAGILVTKKLKGYLPLYFDEIYYLETQQSSKGTSHYLITDREGIYQGRSRLARKGGDQKEPIKPNIRELLKKGGYPYEDKELL